MSARIPPPIVFLVTAVLMWLVSRWWPAAALQLPARSWLFWVLLLSGIFIMGSGIAAIFKHKTVIHPDRASLPKATTLVTTGIFRFSRNPIYLGMLIILIAWFVRLGNWIALSGTVFFVAFITQYQIKPEEVVLQQLFGEAYARYKSRTRRWI